MSELVKKLNANLFWDVDPGTIDDRKNRRYLIQRVLERGGIEDIRQTVAFYTLQGVVDEAREVQYLPPKALSFIACLANLPREAFKCYTRTQLPRAPWIY